MTAMEQLDEAVQRMASEGWDREGVVTGFVVMASTSRYNDEGQALYATDYGVGPSTDLTRAVGLVEVARRKMYRDLGTSED